MARVRPDITNLDRQTWNSLYPWHEWLDGRVWELIPDEDFLVKVRTMQTMVHNRAIMAGLHATTRITETGSLLIQAVNLD